ncbi:MAG: histidinol phosphatase [Anaerolineae bacterium]|nr:histidinol phosphatase [Anaerolineae bacterium]
MLRSDDSIEKVRFEVPDLTQLRNEGLSAVDMHFHTVHSDGHFKVHQVLAKARRTGLGLAITDHNVVSGSLQAFRERGDLLIIPGMEVSAFDGPHILTYFYSHGDLEDFFHRHIEPNRQGSPWLAIKLGTQEIIDRAESYNCVTVAAHPYGYLLFNKGLQKCIEGKYLPPETMKRFDGLEVICGSMTHSLNVKAMKLAEERNLSFTGGTDAHLLSDVGGVVTCAPEDTLEGFLDAVASRRNVVIGYEKRGLKKIATGAVVMTKHSRYLLPGMAINYQQNAHRLKHYVRGLRAHREKDKPK